MKVLFSLIFILIAHTAIAEDMRYYDIEVVVIENLRSRTHTEQSENWPVDVTLKQPEKTVQLGEPVPAEWLPAGVDAKASYTVLDAKEYKLTPQVDKISESNSQRVIFHTAWRQPGLDKDLALPVYFKREIPAVPEIETTSKNDATTPNPAIIEHKTTPSVLEGILRVTLARYLHFEGEMTLRDVLPESETVNNPFSSYNSETPSAKQHVIYFNQDRRRIRSGELHYLDHPVISMLLQITPYEKAEAVSTATGKKVKPKSNTIKR